MFARSYVCCVTAYVIPRDRVLSSWLQFHGGRSIKDLLSSSDPEQSALGDVAIRIVKDGVDKEYVDHMLRVDATSTTAASSPDDYQHRPFKRTCCTSYSGHPVSPERKSDAEGT